MSIPQLSQVLIRSYASSQSWQRGEAIYQNGSVRRVVQGGGLERKSIIHHFLSSITSSVSRSLPAFIEFLRSFLFLEKTFEQPV